MAVFELSNRRTGWAPASDAGAVLTPIIAQRIVDRVDASLGIQVSVACPNGRVVASTHPELVGAWHALAAACLEVSGQAETEGPSPGVGYPLFYDDAVVGAILLHDRPEHAREFVRVIETLAELLIHQTMVVERLTDREQLRDTFLADLLHGRLPAASPGSRPREAAVLGIDLTTPRVAVAVGVEAVVARELENRARGGTLPVITRGRRLARLRAELVRRALLAAACDDDAACGLVDDGWFVMLAPVEPASLEAERDRIGRRVAGLVDDLARWAGVELSAGIGRYYGAWPTLAQSFADACFAAETGWRLHGPNRVFAIEELGLAPYLGDTGGPAKADLACRVLRPLAESPELRATLEAYLTHDLSPAPTARALHIHRHTLSYRLDRIRQLTCLDPRRFQDAAQLHAALLILRMLGGDGALA